MKKITIELLREENSFAGWGWYPLEWKLNIDDYVCNWANENNAFVYKHELQSGEYIYNPPKYSDNPKYPNQPLCTHTKELVIYYYDIKEVPKEFKFLKELKDKINEVWEEQCNQN